MTNERRSRDRCPTCQGPIKEVEGGIRCRNSTCAYNHRLELCPRCKHPGPSVNMGKGDELEYTCTECTYKWRKAGEVA